MTDNKIEVSIIIPCRNEVNFIAKCIESIRNNDYSKNMLEVLIVDGLSEDGTRDIVNEYCQKHSYIHMLDNQKRIIPAALNIGILKARGNIIIRMDAHNIYDNNYISNCVHYLQNNEADNVGGLWVTLPGRDNMIGKSIAFALSHPFGVGNATYRTGSKEPKYVDTVPFGCYKREVFDKIGLYDEDLMRNEDDEFNTRLIKNGGKILLVPEIVSHYYARDTLLKLWRMCYQYGYFKPLAALKVGSVFTLRQLIPTAFVGSLLVKFLCAFFVNRSIHIKSAHFPNTINHTKVISAFKFIPFGVSVNI